MRSAEVDASVTTELRRAVLRPTWAPGTPMAGDADPEAVHIAVLSEDGSPIGACVLLRNQCPHHAETETAWQLRGMATAPEHRGRGIGSAVLAAAVEAVRRRRASLLWCHARSTAVGFYAAHGFAIDGDDYVEAETGLEHRDMNRTL